MVKYIILHCCLILITATLTTLIDRKSKWLTNFYMCLCFTPYYMMLLTLAKLLRIKFLVTLMENGCGLLYFAFFIASIVLCIGFDDILANGYDSSMHRLDHTEADGQKIVTYITNDDKYSKEYLPEELQASSARDVGYILEITKSSKSDTYRNLSTYMDEKVTVQTLNLKLIDCDTNRTVASEFIDQEFPGSTREKFISVPESMVRDWVSSVYPE